MDLEKIYQSALLWCKDNQVSLFKGLLPEGGDNFLTALWDLDEDASVENFLSIAKTNQVSILYVSKTIYSKFEFEDIKFAAEDMAEDKSLDRSTRELATETIKKIASLDRYSGQVRSLDISFLMGNVVHSFIATVSWNEAYEEIQRFNDVAEELEESGEEE